MATQQKADIIDNSDNSDNSDNESKSKNEHKSNRKCISIDKCAETRRIMDTLIYYQSSNAQPIDSLVDYCTNKHKTLIDDYNHIITYHSNDIELIYDFIKQNKTYQPLLSCEFTTCSMYKRSNRNRDSVPSNSNTDLSFIFWRDLMDQMHSFILHSLDSGIRIKKNIQQSTDNITQYDEKKADNNDVTYIDPALQLMSKEISQRQKVLEKLNIENKRFITHKFDLNMNIYKKQAHFNVGFTFYYWPYYKNQNNVKQYWFNQNNYLGYNASELY
eukprot:506230_1